MTQKILHLNLFKKWFDEIKSGKKTKEYRQIKPYWTKRLFGLDGKPKSYDYILFRNGYQKNAPTMKVEFKGVEIDKRRREYAIILGKVIG